MKTKGIICCCGVKFLGKNGTDRDLEFAKKNLKIGQIYTVYRIDIEDWKTLLSLKGLPNDYNSVMFEPIEWIEQL